MGEDLLEGVPIAALIIEITFSENILNDRVPRNVDDLHVRGNSPRAFDLVFFDIKQNVESFVPCGGIDLNKMILQGADQDQIAFF